MTDWAGVVSAHPDGAAVEVWVVPGAAHPAIVGPYAGALKIRVQSPPQGGRATAEAGRVLAAALRVRRVELVTGGVRRRKRYLARGVAPAEAAARLARAVS